MHNTKQKEARIIDTLEPVTSSHRLVVSEEVAADQELQRQFTRITRQRNCLGRDDRIDALAGVIAQFQITLNVDAGEAADRERQRRIDDELREFRRMAGQHTPEPRWFHHN